jgi:hypothetical protein
MNFASGQILTAQSRKRFRSCRGGGEDGREGSRDAVKVGQRALVLGLEEVGVNFNPAALHFAQQLPKRSPKIKIKVPEGAAFNPAHKRAVKRPPLRGAKVLLQDVPLANSGGGGGIQTNVQMSRARLPQKAAHSAR